MSEIKINDASLGPRGSTSKRSIHKLYEIKKAFLNLLLISLINFLEDFYFAVKLHVGLINARNLQLMHITHVFTQKSVEKLDIGKLDNTLISAIDENFFVKKQLLNS